MTFRNKLKILFSRPDAYPDDFKELEELRAMIENGDEWQAETNRRYSGSVRCFFTLCAMVETAMSLEDLRKAAAAVKEHHYIVTHIEYVPGYLNTDWFH